MTELKNECRKLGGNAIYGLSITKCVTSTNENGDNLAWHVSCTGTAVDIKEKEKKQLALISHENKNENENENEGTTTNNVEKKTNDVI